MREGITVEVSAADRARLEAVVADRTAPQRHVWGAEIILATAEDLGTNTILHRTGKSKPCVWRWQERFMAEGVAGLRRDKTRPPGTPRLSDATVERVVEFTREAPPGEATRWTGRARAKAASASARCRGSGRRTGWSRTGSGPSSCRAIPSSSPSCATSSGS